MDKIIINGLSVKHKIITPICRQNKGNIGAFNEAINDITKAYEKYSLTPENKDIKWHIVLIRDDNI